MGGKFFGGYDDFNKAHVEGKLMSILDSHNISYSYEAVFRNDDESDNGMNFKVEDSMKFKTVFSLIFVRCRVPVIFACIVTAVLCYY